MLLATIRDAVMARGKTDLGAKTIIDGLDALTHGLAPLAKRAEIASVAQTAMSEVMDTFRNRPCTIGRARMFGEKSIGLDDPGMLALSEVVVRLAEPLE